MKKQSNLSRLMGYAGGHKILTYLSWVLSVMSALLALVPFWYIWCIIHDILEVSPDFSQAENVTGYGWSAVLFAVISIVVYIAALMCSHLSAFRVAANIRKELMRHIAALPLMLDAIGARRNAPMHVHALPATIAALTGDEATTIEDFYEPYLLQLGFIERTPRGRRVTPKAKRHLQK